MRELSAKWVQKCLNADQKPQRCLSSKQILEFFRRHPNDFVSRLVTMNESWLYHYDPETKQQPMEWRHSNSPHPKKFRVQKSAGKFSHWLFGIKTAFSSSIISKEPNYQRGVLLISGGAIGGHLLRKNNAGMSPSWSCSCTTMSRLTRQLQPRRNWPTWASSVLITHRILRICPHRTTTCSLDWKSNWEFAIFRPTEGHLSRGDLVGRTTIWNLLSGFQKLGQWSKKCIGLRGEYVE